MKLLFSILFCLFGLLCYAQQSVDVNKTEASALSQDFFMVVGDQPFLKAKFSKLVEGSPYFQDEWMKGELKLNNGNIYSGIYLKLDLLGNEIHYQNKKGEEMITTIQFEKLILFDTVMRTGFQFVHAEFIGSDPKPEKGWYEKLTDGNVTLYKKYMKVLDEDKPYGSATTEQRIKTIVHYYVLHNNSFERIKKLKDLAELLSDKKDVLLKSIKEKKLSDKEENDYIYLVNYYNEMAEK